MTERNVRRIHESYEVRAARRAARYVPHPCQFEACGKDIQVGFNDTVARYNSRKYCNKLCAGAARRTKRIEHGTTAGYQKCVGRPEGACPSCKAAQSSDWHDRQVHRRAAAALIELHPEEYQLLRDKLADLREGVPCG